LFVKVQKVVFSKNNANLVTFSDLTKVLVTFFCISIFSARMENECGRFLKRLQSFCKITAVVLENESGRFKSIGRFSKKFAQRKRKKLEFIWTVRKNSLPLQPLLRSNRGHCAPHGGCSSVG